MPRYPRRGALAAPYALQTPLPATLRRVILALGSAPGRVGPGTAGPFLQRSGTRRASRCANAVTRR